MDDLQDGELVLLAKDVPHTKFSQLCDALGKPYARGQKILATHLNNFDVAMQQLLMEWKMKQTDPTQSRSILASKLRDIGLGELGDKLSQGAYRPNQCDPRDIEMDSLQSISDIYNTKISDSLTVGQCREKLVNKYLTSFCKIKKAPWDPDDFADFKDLHTVVTMVKKDAHGKDTKTKELLQGSVDEIFSAQVNGRLPARILISAPAGRGKTTAVAKMAYNWANRVQGSSLENLPLLFAVKLRNTNKQTSIAEAIRSQLLSDVDDLSEDGLHDFIRRNQGICHIILDGLDEFAGIAANQGLGSNICDVMLWKEFPNCRVLVTTRPHLENFFNQGELPRVYTKMWIEGFSRDNSRAYIDKFFALTSNPSSGQDLKVYLDDQPLINELVTTPLFCLMVCQLWREGLLGNDTTTQTELLDSVNLFLMHHANARSKYKLTEKKLGKIICKLGEVALAGLLDDANKLIFTLHDFRKVPATLDMACELGVVSKTTTTSARLPKASETTSTTVEFYHKLAQEHSAGKCLANQTNRHLLRWKISKLDRVLRRIKVNIGEYENIIRFAAGTDNRLCIRIMEAILKNSLLDESEQCRLLLDCSSETLDTEGSVSSIVQRCVTAQSMVLKSPTIYTVVGMQNLPKQLINQIREVKFEDSGISADVTSGLWSSLRSFPSLQSLKISDSALNFPLSTPVLPSVTKLIAERVTSQSYEGLLSSLPSLKEINVTIDDAEKDITRISAGLRRTGRQRCPQLTEIRLRAPSSLPGKKEVSTETMRGLGLLIKEQSENIQVLSLSGVQCQDEDALVDLVESCRHVKTMDYLELLDCGSKQGGRLESYTKELLNAQDSFRVFLPLSQDDLENSTNGYKIIRLDEYGVEVRIPLDEADDLGDVAVEALTTTPPDLVLNENEVVISVGLKVSSSNHTFKTPMTVTLPHCGSFTNPEEAELVLYNRATDSDSFRATPCTATGFPRCVVTERDLELHIDHFSEWWITVRVNKMFGGKYLSCTPYIPEEIHKNKKHLLYLWIKNENNRERMGIAGYKTAFPETRFFVKWSPRRKRDLEITYRRDNEVKCAEKIPVSTLRYIVNMYRSFPFDAEDGCQSLIEFQLQQKFTDQISFFVSIKDKPPGEVESPAAPRPEAGPLIPVDDDEEVTDERLLQLSKRLPPNLYNDIHVALGVEYSMAAGIREKNILPSDKYYDLLQKWKVKSRRTVKDLKEALTKAEAGGLKL